MAKHNQWIPLESNPEVFNSWATKAGLVTSLAKFQDVYGLDDELLALVPKPVKAVILLFPLGEDVQEKRKNEDLRIAERGQVEVDETIFWIKQTISNACGTLALIHAIANVDVTISPMSPLSRLIDQCRDKTPLERAHILETTPLFTHIHAELAASGQTHVPENLDTDLHFTCFVQAPSGAVRRQASDEVDDQMEDEDPDAEGEPSSVMRLIELDGTRSGPIDRGECTDILKSAAEYIKKAYVSESSSMNFSMIALGGREED